MMGAKRKPTAGRLVIQPITETCPRFVELGEKIATVERRLAETTVEILAIEKVERERGGPTGERGPASDLDVEVAELTGDPVPEPIPGAGDLYRRVAVCRKAIDNLRRKHSEEQWRASRENAVQVLPHHADLARKFYGGMRAAHEAWIAREDLCGAFTSAGYKAEAIPVFPVSINCSGLVRLLVHYRPDPIEAEAKRRLKIKL